MQIQSWLLTFLVAVPLFGQPLTVQLDAAQTHVDFTLHDVLHTVHGTFALKSTTLMIDPTTGAASGSLTVDAKSGNSGSSARDSRMHKNILESDRYPEIVFVPDRMVGVFNQQGTSDIQLHGTLTLHGGSHETTLKVHSEIANGELKATGQFLVPYVKWGLKNPSTLILRVSDTVEIDIHATGRLSAGS